MKIYQSLPAVVLWLMLGPGAAMTAQAEEQPPSAAGSHYWPNGSHYWPNKIWVDCDKGRSLKKVVKHRATSGTIIYVTGTCNERITITKDRIKIKAQGTASLDGTGVGPADPEFNPLITIDGATGVVLDGLTIQNSSAEGIIVQRNASATLRDITLTGNANAGMLVDHARVDFENSSSSGNLVGVDSFNNASVVFRGQADLSQNFVFGLGASNGAALELRGAQLDISQNGQFGMIVEGGHMAIFNFGVSQGSSINANNNGLWGVVAVGGGRIDIVAPPPFQNTGINQFSASGNGLYGIWLAGNGYIESPFGAAIFTIEKNRVGLRVEGNSSVQVVGGMQVKKNVNVGIQGDGAGVITVVSSDGMPSPNPSEITGNGTDVKLDFGSRATFGAAIDTIVCDSSSMARGSISCP